jgi:hypothetical protein
MQHPFFWGFILGAGAYYLYEHYFPSPKMNTGKYARG